MHDIALCANTKCPLRASCNRYTATPNGEWQTYADWKWEKVLIPSKYGERWHGIICDGFEPTGDLEP